MRTSSIILGFQLFILILALQCSPSRRTAEAWRADPTTPRRYLCCRSTGPIEIDGRLDEKEWTHAQWTEPFVDIRGSAFSRPRLTTRVRMLWDDENLYIAADIEEPDVRATLTERDSIVFWDNDFEVFLDPDGNAREYFEVEVNALNTIFDLFLERTYRNGGPVHHEWNLVGIVTAVQIDGTLNYAGDRDRGWSVEMALPWRALAEYAGTRTPPHTGDVWRMNFSRVQWPDNMRGASPQLVGKGIEDNWVWSPQGVVDMHIPQRWGMVEFTVDAQICNNSRTDRRLSVPPRGNSRP